MEPLLQKQGPEGSLAGPFAPSGLWPQGVHDPGDLWHKADTSQQMRVGTLCPGRPVSVSTLPSGLHLERMLRPQLVTPVTVLASDPSCYSSALSSPWFSAKSFSPAVPLGTVKRGLRLSCLPQARVVCTVQHPDLAVSQPSRPFQKAHPGPLPAHSDPCWGLFFLCVLVSGPSGRSAPWSCVGSRQPRTSLVWYFSRTADLWRPATPREEGQA